MLNDYSFDFSNVLGLSLPLVKILEYENYFESIAVYYANDVNFTGKDDSFILAHSLMNKMINKIKNIIRSEWFRNSTQIS